MISVLRRWVVSCRWIDDRCQHGCDIDDPQTIWNPTTRNYSCPLNLTDRKSA